MTTSIRHIAPSKVPSTDERLTVIIPAAGIGRRMKSRGPKALLPISHGQSILEKQMRVISKVYPKVEFIVIAGFQINKIRKLWKEFPFRLIYNNIFDTTNVVYSVSLGLDAALPGSVMVVHGDLVFNKECVDGLAGEASSLLIDPEGDTKMGSGEVGVSYQEGIVRGMSYALPIKWGQIAFFQGKELRLLRQLAFNRELSGEMYMWEAIQYIIKKKGVFLSHRPSLGKIVEIDSASDIIAAKSV